MQARERARTRDDERAKIAARNRPNFLTTRSAKKTKTGREYIFLKFGLVNTNRGPLFYVKLDISKLSITQPGYILSKQSSSASFLPKTRRGDEHSKMSVELRAKRMSLSPSFEPDRRSMSFSESSSNSNLLSPTTVLTRSSVSCSSVPSPTRHSQYYYAKPNRKRDPKRVPDPNRTSEQFENVKESLG